MAFCIYKSVFLNKIIQSKYHKMFGKINSVCLDISNIELFYRVIIFHFKRKLNKNNKSLLAFIEFLKILRNFMCHITFFFLFYSGFDFSTRICGSFRKRFHNNSSKKLLSSKAQTEGTSLFLVQFFFSTLNFLNERSRIINVGVVFQSAQNIRAQNPMRLVQAFQNEYLFAPQSSISRCFL